MKKFSLTLAAFFAVSLTIEACPPSVPVSVGYGANPCPTLASAFSYAAPAVQYVQVPQQVVTVAAAPVCYSQPLLAAAPYSYGAGYGIGGYGVGGYGGIGLYSRSLFLARNRFGFGNHPHGTVVLRR